MHEMKTLLITGRHWLRNASFFGKMNGNIVAETSVFPWKARSLRDVAIFEGEDGKGGWLEG